MLFDAAAVPTSVALDAVAEAFGVHENGRLIVPIADTWNGDDDLIPDLNALESLAALSPVASPAPDALPVDAPSIVVPDSALGLAVTQTQSVVTSTVDAISEGLAPGTEAVPDVQPIIGPDVASGESTQGGRLLQQISLVPPGTIRTFLKDNPEAVATLLASPPAASDVTVWWNALGPARRGALRITTPQLVGNLDGIPFSARDLANRTLLSSTMRQLEKTIDSDAGRTVIDNAKQQLKMLTSISDSLGTSDSVPARTLMSLDVTGQGKAAIVLGDLRTADYVSYLVPGMFFTIENQMGDWVDAAARLYDEQLSWLQLFKDSGAGAGAGAGAQSTGDQSVVAQDQTVATVAWIGYHTPNLTNVGGIENADQGRDSLAAAIAGLQSIRAGNEPYVTVIAHSYGSTAALMALTEFDFEIDALAMVGSPGSPAKSVSELHVRNGNVYVGEAAWDPIPNSSYFGSDPGAVAYGAKPLGVNGTTDMITHALLLSSTGHNEYFSPGTESMRNFALIGINKGEYVTYETGTPLTKGLASAPR